MPGVFGLAQQLSTERAPRRVLVVMPTWLGDCVMATPTLRALRGLYPKAEMVALVGEKVAPILEPCPWVEQVMTTSGEGLLTQAGRLAKRRFDLAVIMPNSFRVAAMTALARIPRRVGYLRDGRGPLLSDRLVPRRERGRFLPMAALQYYLALARYLGATHPDPAMTLATTEEDDQRAANLLQGSPNAPAHAPAPKADDKLILLNPGAQKPTKRWPAERFAQLADRLVAQHGAVIAVTAGPAERTLVNQILAGAQSPIIDLPAQGLDLRLLKAVIGRTDLLITGDTGPRHIAAALGTPLVTLFGPTDPPWTEIHFAKERQILAPGQLQTADDSDLPNPPRHMGLIEVEPVYEAACELLGLTPGKAQAGPVVQEGG